MSQIAAQDDAAAIMKVIADEFAALWNKDFDAFERCWVHASYVRRVGWWKLGGISLQEGWDQLGNHMRQIIGENRAPNPSATEVRRENINLRISGDVAWVTFDQYGPDTGEYEFDMPGLSRETRVLERRDGAWIIAYESYLLETLVHMRSAMMRVDRQAVVSWMNRAAEKDLKENGILVLRKGRLHATDGAADERLQEAILWAGSRDDKRGGSRGATPVVLDGVGEEACVCWVVAEGSGSGTVVVSINDRMFGRDRLDSAALVYGLSPSQIRLAELIVAGKGLVEGAERLGVSVNTVRTQLQRMFEKTGVRSQPALVRALLSVAPPG